MTADTPSPHLTRSAVGRAARSATGRAARAVTSLSSVRATGRFVRRQLWAWPLVAVVGLAGAGWAVDRAVEGALRENRAAALTTILDADVTALRVWMAEEQVNAEFVAGDDPVRPLVRDLLARADGGPGAARALVGADAQAALRARLAPKLKLCGHTGFLVVSPAGVVVAADHDAPVGHPVAGYQKEFFAGVAAGAPSVSKPYRCPFLLADEAGELRAGLPTMMAAAPVRDEAGRPIAALGLRARPDAEFTRILQVARQGETGETYAFDRDGTFLSESRFTDDLKQLGLVVDAPDSRAVLSLAMRDPGADLTAGGRPAGRRADLPPTRPAAEAPAGRDGCDPDGYRDYRGVPVVGAWRWLPEYDFGVVTEVDVAEAFAPAVLLRRAFQGLMALLAAGAGVTFGVMAFAARQQKALQAAVLQAKRLGQYTLEDKLGAGGMGTVYRARHALLRRPTAVKLLDPDKLSAAAAARFEREVQMTAQLTHPNTVGVFDYGRTPEGLFFYAMEYLDGVTLDGLVARHGPVGEARAVFLLRQVCGALAEAHALGLVHRDVKPANIFLTRRGGLADFVKVLDFGLVKEAGGADLGVTAHGVVTGTPLYLSPEGISRPDRVDARADVYAVGAVGYYLLTGTPVFAGGSVIEICTQHLHEAPEPPSARLGRPVSAGLEALILRCLAKDPGARPGDAGALGRELDRCEVAGTWTADDAAGWWAAHAGGPGRAQPADPPATPGPAAGRTLAYHPAAGF